DLNDAGNAFVHAPPGRTGPLAYRGRGVTTEEGWRQCMDDVLRFSATGAGSRDRLGGEPMTPSNGMGESMSPYEFPVRKSREAFRGYAHHVGASGREGRMPHPRNREGPPLPHSVHREDLAEELTTKGLWADSLG